MKEKATAFAVGATGYPCIEILARGHTHWSMALLGGICVLALVWIARRYPGMNIMLTMGKSGCLYKSADETVRLGACHVDAVDTTAAGDTFIGYFVRGILQGLPMRDTLRQATVASAIAVTRPGAADSVPSIDEVLASPLLDTI